MSLKWQKESEKSSTACKSSLGLITSHTLYALEHVDLLPLDDITTSDREIEDFSHV